MDDFTYRVSTDTNYLIVNVVSDSIQITTKDNIFGKRPVSIEVDDGTDTVLMWFNVNILPVNDPPNIEIPDFSFDEDTTYYLQFSDYYEDVDNNQNEM